MLTFAGIAPHSLELLKSPKKLSATLDALKEMQKTFLAAKPEIVVIISPHGTILQKAFAVNLAQDYEVDLLDLGVKLPKRTYKGDPLNTVAIRKERLTDTEAPVTLVSARKLDYGSAIPLSFLVQKDDATIIPVSPSEHDLATQYAFGNTMKEIIMGSTKRFAVIASAGLARDQKSKAFDAMILENLSSDEKVKELLAVSDATQKEADACGFRPIVMLMGILQGLPWTYQQLSYETVLRGLLVASFTVQT